MNAFNETKPGIERIPKLQQNLKALMHNNPMLSREKRMLIRQEENLQSVKKQNFLRIRKQIYHVVLILKKSVYVHFKGLSKQSERIHTQERVNQHQLQDKGGLHAIVQLKATGSLRVLTKPRHIQFTLALQSIGSFRGINKHYPAEPQFRANRVIHISRQFHAGLYNRMQTPLPNQKPRGK